MPYDERLVSNIPSVHYEFPTGYHQDFGPERFKLAEGLFDHAMLGAGYIGWFEKFFFYLNFFSNNNFFFCSCHKCWYVRC